MAEDNGPEAIIVAFQDIWTDTRWGLILQASSSATIPQINTCTINSDNLCTVQCDQQVVKFCINTWIRFLHDRGPYRATREHDNVWVTPLEYADWVLGRRGKTWIQSEHLGAQYRLERKDFEAARSSFTKMVIPVLDADRRHYWVAVVHMEDDVWAIEVYDSLGPSNCHAAFFQKLRQNEGGKQNEDRLAVAVIEASRQGDSISCGIFTMLFMAHAAGLEDSREVRRARLEHKGFSG